jgi:hypothetical protein
MVQGTDIPRKKLALFQFNPHSHHYTGTAELSIIHL